MKGQGCYSMGTAVISATKSRLNVKL